MKTPKMKPAKVKLKTQKLKHGKPPTFSKEADKLADEYLSAGVTVKACEATQSKCREQIFALASEDCAGISDDGKTYYRTGDHSKIGFTQVMTAPSIDTDKLKAQLPPGVLKQVMRSVVTEQFDEAAFIKLVEDGTIDRTLVAACTIPPQPKHTRILIEKLAS